MSAPTEVNINCDGVMQMVVDCLSAEEADNEDFSSCVDDGLEECSLTKSFPCQHCSKVCKSKGGLTLHTRLKHPTEDPSVHLPSPITAADVQEMVDKAMASTVKSGIYGDLTTAILSRATLSPSELLVQSISELYADYCKQLNRDKLLQNFYKLALKSSAMFETDSIEISDAMFNIILIRLPDLLVVFYKRGHAIAMPHKVKEIVKSEYGPLSYLAGYIISKMYRRSKLARQQDSKQAELQSVLLVMKSIDPNDYIDSLSRGKLWNPTDSLLVIVTECEKAFRQYCSGIVKEIPLDQLVADILLKPKVQSARESVLSDASLAKTDTLDICLENIAVLYVRVRSFSYAKDIVTKFKLKEKLSWHKKALRKTLKMQTEGNSSNDTLT